MSDKFQLMCTEVGASRYICMLFIANSCATSFCVQEIHYDLDIGLQFVPAQTFVVSAPFACSLFLLLICIFHCIANGNDYSAGRPHNGFRYPADRYSS